jgi:hypothetical protein
MRHDLIIMRNEHNNRFNWSWAIRAPTNYKMKENLSDVKGEISNYPYTNMQLRHWDSLRTSIYIRNRYPAIDAGCDFMNWLV